MCNMGYKQCNSDYTVFYNHSGGCVTILVVYVDDMIITGNDPLNISQLKKNLCKEFEVKDLGQLWYFLGIEIARSPKGIVLSQCKYVLDLLHETCMLGCHPASSPIEHNHKICAQCGDPVDKKRYQRLVGRLIYLCHTRPDVTYAINIVSQYMHDLRSGHLDVVYRIVRHLKSHYVRNSNRRHRSETCAKAIVSDLKKLDAPASPRSGTGSVEGKKKTICFSAHLS
jgi:hypothetical protein